MPTGLRPVRSTTIIVHSKQVQILGTPYLETKIVVTEVSVIYNSRVKAICMLHYDRMVIIRYHW